MDERATEGMEKMSVKDVIKNSVMEAMKNNSLSMTAVCITIGICILFSLYIFGIYYLSQKKRFYHKDLNIVLAVLPVLTAGIILAMQSNLIISLGMVGALSIVRFRTAIKEPKDLLFLFWSISTGIILGAMNYELAFVIAIAVTLLLFLLELLPGGRAAVLLVVNMDTEGREEELLHAVKQYVKYPRVKSRNRTAGGTDYIIECKTAREQELLDCVSVVKHVMNTSLIAHDGEAVY